MEFGAFGCQSESFSIVFNLFIFDQRIKINQLLAIKGFCLQVRSVKDHNVQIHLIRTNLLKLKKKKICFVLQFKLIPMPRHCSLCFIQRQTKELASSHLPWVTGHNGLGCYWGCDSQTGHIFKIIVTLRKKLIRLVLSTVQEFMYLIIIKIITCVYKFRIQHGV